MNKNCKKIIAWTNWTKDGILKEFPEVKHKVEVVYPGIPPQNVKKIKTQKIRLLFSSRSFYFKGGLYAIEIIDRMTKKYSNVEGIIVSDIPNEIIKKYEKNKNLQIYKMMPQKKLFYEIYPSIDIFVHPSFTDTFGFPFTEAMAFGIPVVTSSGHARPEIVTNGKTGFVVEVGTKDGPGEKFLHNLRGNEHVIEKFCEKVSYLIENKSIREKMGNAAYEEIKEGKFSFKERDEKLEKIYKEAFNN